MTYYLFIYFNSHDLFQAPSPGERAAGVLTSLRCHTSAFGGRGGRLGCEESENRLWWVARVEGLCCRRGDGARNGDPGSDAPRIRWACSCWRCVAAPTEGWTPSAGEMAPEEAVSQLKVLK